MDKKKELDEQEIKIIKELIRNVRISDNQISRNTLIPLKTVNTKRKKLENEKIIEYFLRINNNDEGTGLFKNKHLYKIILNNGITRKNLIEKTINQFNESETLRKHADSVFFGEENGHITIHFILESYSDKDIIEIFNSEIYNIIERNLGRNSIKKTESSIIFANIKLFHNYNNNFNSKGYSLNKNLFVYEK